MVYPMNTKGSLWILVTNTQLQFRFQILYSIIFTFTLFIIIWASRVTQMVKNLPAKWETWVWSLCLEDPLEEGMTTHSSILAWRILWTEESGRLQSMGSQRVGRDWVTDIFTFTFFISSHIEVGKWYQVPGGFTIWIWIFDMDSENWRYLFLKIINNLI